MYYLIVFLVLIYIIHTTKTSYKLYNVQSTVDNELYLVEKTNNQLYDIEKADILAKVNDKINILIKSLSTSDGRRKL